mmetsp:Transcript_2160/g.6404  ORF Transcript_2160/g.6404 Transcript_2160/m.6404 type:complete len:590 (+) Transcript_2160:131-1900(+)|eukprot:CAMPEP_0198657894 /NCGR_PEP_ID=MMETSP1467-20131203/20950_1 /TAXON_ID=1462469 /ORGANISM="unid. sp., Strain CCMP2135" /LENGTH=589 /DNA_ID=CAMNT_0044394129 /DNA_START=53 /DNA_END=1822 /DNA_ORIENTATION=+
MLRALVLVLAPASVLGHGYLFEPKSRQRLANEAGMDYCPHCTLAAPMKSEGDFTPSLDSRAYPGDRPFAEPGSAPSVTMVMDGHSTPFGVCGTQKLGSNDYNVVEPGVWGEDVIVAQYKQGEVIDVSWCVNADHGGVYSWRFCDKPDLVAKLWQTEPLSAEVQLEIEKCYQDGMMRCDSVEDNDCSFEPRCKEGWGCSSDEGAYFHCLGSLGGPGSYECANTQESCSSGVQVRHKLKIPDTFPVGKTVMTWRWDSDETVEVFAACADVEILPGEFSPTAGPTSAAPTLTKAPTPGETATPTQEPTEDGVGTCCFWSPYADVCSDCRSPAAPDNWCAPSRGRCEHCGGKWCPGAGPPKPSPAPVPAPTPSCDTINFDGKAVADFTTFGKNKDDVYAVDGCEVTVEKATWIVVALDEPHVVRDASMLTFCFQQEAECALHAIAPTNTPDNFSGGPIFAVAGGNKGWAVPKRDFAYTTFGQVQCFDVPLGDYAKYAEFTHLAFVNQCSDQDPAHAATWSAVDFSYGNTGAPSAAPTARYGYTGDDAHCCLVGSCDKDAGGCYAPAFAPYFCGKTAGSCVECGGVFCEASSSY